MLRLTLFLMIAPLVGVVAQAAPVHLTITSANQTEFRVLRQSRDSVQRPLFGRGRLELVADSGVAAQSPFESLEITTLDTTGQIRVEATQAGRVIASGDGAYVTIRHEAEGISIEARSHAPAAVLRTLRRP